jgi:hypothetical protein
MTGDEAVTHPTSSRRSRVAAKQQPMRDCRTEAGMGRDHIDFWRATGLSVLVGFLLAIGLGYATPDAGATVAPAPYSGPPGTVGTEFWFAFGANIDEEGGIEGINYVDIGGTTATTATVAVPALGFSTDVSVAPGQATTVELPSGTNLQTTDGVEDLAVHVTAAAPVSVYGLEDVDASTDGFTALPVTGIGTNYYALGYEALPGEPPEFAPSDFQVVGAEDNTAVTITPSAKTAQREAGMPYTIDLNAGETYQLIGESGQDLTGTHISSSAPVSVLAGAQCADIPSLEYEACNYVAEQMPPTTESLATRTNGDTFRVLASQAGTTVTINGAIVDTLEAGQFYQTQLTEASTLVTSQPALVAQYSDSDTFDNVEGDPSETLIPPTAQFLKSYTYATPAARFTNYINVIAPSSETDSLLLDGSTISSSDFTAIGASGFSGAQIPVEAGTHTLSGSQAFGITAYGFAPYDAYSYSGGYAEAGRIPQVPSIEPAAGAPATTAKSGVPGSVAVTLPPPTLAVTGDVAPVSGRVLVRLPGTRTFVALSSLQQIPFGTAIEATHGRVRVTTAGPHGGAQTGEFFEGEFVLTQKRDGMVVATLAGGDFSVCPAARERSHLARVSSTHASGKHVVRKLWTNDHGSFSTTGNYVSTTVEGTEWLTEDLCEGTLVRVTRDKVAVTNLVNHRHVIVTAGHSYLAKAP